MNKFNPTYTNEELEGLKQAMKDQEERSARLKAEREKESEGLRKIMKEQEARREARRKK